MGRNFLQHDRRHFAVVLSRFWHEGFIASTHNMNSHIYGNFVKTSPPARVVQSPTLSTALRDKAHQSQTVETIEGLNSFHTHSTLTKLSQRVLFKRCIRRIKTPFVVDFYFEVQSGHTNRCIHRYLNKFIQPILCRNVHRDNEQLVAHWVHHQ